jgi:hypothetical protein
MYQFNLIQFFAIAISLTTAVGVLIHDTKIDQATTTALAVPIVMAGFESIDRQTKFAGDPHTHSERSSLSQAIRDLRASGGTPRVQPRDDDKKYHLQKKVAKGTHAFDGYYMPLDSI